MYPNPKCCIHLPQTFFWGDEYKTPEIKNIEFPQYHHAAEVLTDLETGTKLHIIQSFSKRALLQIIEQDSACRLFLKQLTEQHQLLVDFTNLEYSVPTHTSSGRYVYSFSDDKVEISRQYKTLVDVAATEMEYNCTLRIYYNIDALCLILNPENLMLAIGLRISYLIPHYFSCTELDYRTRKIKDIKVNHHAFLQEAPLTDTGLFLAKTEDLTLRGHAIL